MIAPLSLRIAAGLAVSEAALLMIVGIFGQVYPSNVGTALGLGALYVLTALGLALAAVGLWERRSWGRAPVALAQLVLLGIGWDLRSGQTLIAVAAFVVGAGALVALLHPASTRALARDS